MNTIKDVTLLVTHYNRSSSLERLLIGFRDLNLKFENIIVSDDGSNRHHLDKIKDLAGIYGFELVTTPKNKGLGNNINKGQDRVKTQFTLYVQEDFIPQELFREKLPIALQILKTDKKYDMARFYAYFNYPFLKQIKGGFCEMVFSPWPWYFGYKKFYYYSDHPHLRRSDFLTKFGRYAEGIGGDRTEYKMMMSVLKKEGKAIFFEDFQALFVQENPSSEPSTMKRNFWRENDNPLIIFTRHAYRYIRFNIDANF